ncbi:MAG: hypothetical protein JJD92_10195 [Frankiaceae bacterium]|nr:hypothetical protein [Frankiaceae bacterium]
MSSSIEERLARDIAAVSGGVVVTDSDLQEVRKAVIDRIHSKRPRVRLGSTAAVAAAAVVLAAGIAGFLTFGDDDRASQPANPGPTPISDPDAEHLTGQAPTAQLIEGVWRVDNGMVLVQFREDGTVRFDEQGTLFSRPVTTGTYVIAGDAINVTITSDAQQSCIGSTFAIRAAMPEVGLLRFARTASDPCVPMPPGRGALDQLLPSSPTTEETRFSQETGWAPLSDNTVLSGVWLAEGGGHLLELAVGGAYYLADNSGAPIDRGQWSLRNSALTLTSSSSSVQCSARDQFVLGAVEAVRPNTIAIRGTVTKNACRGAWTPATWILIPHAGS